MNRIIYLIIILIIPLKLFSQTADIMVEYSIVNDTAFNANLKVKRTGNTSWAFGSSSFVINFNHNGLTNPRIVRRGYWDNTVNSQYTPIYSSLYGTSAVSLEIDYFGPNGGGAVLPDTFTSIGVLQFHISNTTLYHNLTWNIGYSAIFDDYRVERTNNINFVNPVNHILDINGKINKIPVDNELYQNYPNPFNSSTKINFILEKSSDVELKIFDFSGKEIRRFYFNNLNPAYHEFNIDFNGYSSGIYILLLKSKYFSKSLKMILVK